MFLVTGATGQLGRRIVRQLRLQESCVRAFVRLRSDYSELENRGAEIFIGELTQVRDIEKAVRGVQFVISAHGGEREALNYRANIDLIDAAKEHGVQHFVFISVLGTDRGYEDAPTFKAKREVEKYLQASGLNFTILRPSGFASNLISLAEQFQRTGVYLLIGDPQSRSSIVSTDDLARIAIASPTLEAAYHQIFSIGGPEILQRQAIPQIFGRIYDREPIILNPPLLAFDGLRTAIGLLNPTVKESLGTLRTLLANEFYITPEEVARIESVYGFKLESLENFMRRYVSP
ncbi:SDR family oxidoreductase [Myxacorys almedinensis]|uniref:NAD(P)H-binding protein n=1 Tax=Myxacorys almedinensis A TaxID=2690445 RepID=A0A8J7Z1F2_9CYAN|nr:SDR family oxidoreductase [Myxacorys almedinensis]NDJ16411.1 NAD(P)H-binding protein [Myxacorys almedinensis A]